MKKSNTSSNLILDVSFKLGVEVVLHTLELKKNKHYEFADQMIRCGLSVGCNSREAQGAESRADFIHKCKIAYKEAKELEFLLEILQAVQVFPKVDSLLELTKSSIRIPGKIIVSSRNNKSS